VPYYFRQKLGEQKGLFSDAPSGSVVDTHESKAVLFPVGAERWTDNFTGREYEQIADFYRAGGRRLGISPETYQAGRWIGGGPLTGLKSPGGDYVQGLEDLLYWSARQTGRGTDARSLRRYWEEIAQGQDFLLPFYGKGGVPIPNSGGLFR
jgi:hypothetical protein